MKDPAPSGRRLGESPDPWWTPYSSRVKNVALYLGSQEISSRKRVLRDSFTLLASSKPLESLFGHENIEKTKLRAEREKGVLLNIDLAIMHHGLGDMDTTFDYLNKASEDMIGALFLKKHPSWDGIRQDLRYPALLKRYGHEA